MVYVVKNDTAYRMALLNRVVHRTVHQHTTLLCGLTECKQLNVSVSPLQGPVHSSRYYTCIGIRYH